jgi:leucyl/phenylalanyl-tRNA--protein transferase
MKKKTNPAPKQPLIEFPDPRNADPETGLLAVGGDFGVERLRAAYRGGIFPWPMGVGGFSAEEVPPLWFSPDPRAVLFFEELHIPRSLARARRKSALRYTVDRAFTEVIEACAAAPRPGQDGTWITSKMLEAYIDLHRAGHAHSFEAWDGEKLVAGLYGVDAGGAFAAESMFHHQDNASKLLVLEVIDHLRARGVQWLDIQVMTPHMERLGAREIKRQHYLALLEEAQAANPTLF